MAPGGLISLKQGTFNQLASKATPAEARILAQQRVPVLANACAKVVEAVAARSRERERLDLFEHVRRSRHVMSWELIGVPQWQLHELACCLVEIEAPATL